MSRRHPSRAFTLIELLIVITILGILAAIVVPRFSTASGQASDNAMREDLRRMRTAVELFRAEHDTGVFAKPNGDLGQDATEAAFVYHLTGFTNVKGVRSEAKTAEYKFGPYLPSIPANPKNKLATVKVLSAGQDLATAATGDTGWVYDPVAGKLHANLTGNDPDGTPYLDY